MKNMKMTYFYPRNLCVNDRKKAINKLFINHKPRKITIGDKSIPPKEGKYLLTKFKLGSHNRYKTSMML